MIKKILNMTSSSQMLVAMVIGFAVGIFFGEMVGWLSTIGTGVILLMQMTVLPYIVVSLVGGIGKLNPKTAKLIFSRAGIIMLLLWALGLLIVALMPLSFPLFESASFSVPVLSSLWLKSIISNFIFPRILLSQWPLVMSLPWWSSVSPWASLY